MVYAISISLQIAGAILVTILSYFKVTKMNKNIIDICFRELSAIKGYDKNGNGIIKKDTVQERVSEIYRNMFATAYIIVGYLSSIFIPNDMLEPKIKLICIIIILTIMLTALGYYIPDVVSKIQFKDDIIIPKDELVKNDITVGNNAIDEIMKS